MTGGQAGRHRHADKQAEKQAGVLLNMQLERHSCNLTGRQANENKARKQKDRKADRQTGRQTGRQKGKGRQACCQTCSWKDIHAL
jgi:hypothetical protein